MMLSIRGNFCGSLCRISGYRGVGCRILVGLDVNLATVRWYEFLVGYERSHEIRT
jgi:hypothetical protein